MRRKRLMLLLGLAEASRSAVLLFGIVLVLGERRKVLTLIAFALLPALLMFALGSLIQGTFTDLLSRLFAGGLGYLVCLGFAIGLLMPDMGLSALKRLRRTFRVKGELG